MILEQTAQDNSGLCAPCTKLIAPRPSRYEALLKTSADKLTPQQKRDQLQGSIQNGNEPRITELLSGSPDFLSEPPDDFTTWVGLAISENCRLEILAKIVGAGCDPNSRSSSPDKTSALEVAVDNDRIDAIQWLLENGADPNLGRELIGAINFRKTPDIQLKMLTMLLDAGANINKSHALYGDETDRFTALDWSILYDVPDQVIDFLKERGAKRLDET
jgi:ankyrin repeat protein